MNKPVLLVPPSADLKFRLAVLFTNPEIETMELQWDSEKGDWIIKTNPVEHGLATDPVFRRKMAHLLWEYRCDVRAALQVQYPEYYLDHETRGMHRNGRNLITVARFSRQLAIDILWKPLNY